MEKIKVYVTCDLNESTWSIKDFDKKVIYLKEVELYCFTEDELGAFKEKIGTQTMNVCGCYLGD